MGTYCSFCGRDDKESEIIIQGEADDAKICDDCITLCIDILREEEDVQVSEDEVDRYICTHITSDKKEQELIKHFSKHRDAIGYHLDSLLDYFMAEKQITTD